jgi:hypothetical protein
VAGDLEGVEVLLELDGTSVTHRPYVGDLSFELVRCSAKLEVIITENGDPIALTPDDLIYVDAQALKPRLNSSENT